MRILPKPKITFDRFGQIYFVFKEVTKIAWKINKRYVIGMYIFGGLIGISMVPGFYLQKLILDQIVDNIGKPNWESTLTILGILLFLRFGLEVFRTLLDRSSRIYRRTLSRYFDVELEMLMSKKLAELDMTTLEDSDFKDKFDKIRRESSRRAWNIMMPLGDIPNQIISFFTSVGVLIFLHPLIALGVVVVGLPRLLVNSRFIKKQYELSTLLAPRHKVAGWLGYYLTRNRNYSELKLLDLPEYLTSKFKDIASGILKLRTDLLRKKELFRVGGELPILVFELIVSGFIVVWTLIGRITVGSLQFYLSSLRSAQSSLQGIAYSLLEIYENYIYVVDLIWFLNLESSVEKSLDEGKLLKPKDGAIEFRNTWFKYKKDQPWVIRGVDIKIEPKEKIALVGLNGAGKSTLIKLLARFYDPQKGSVMFDGESISGFNLRSWRKNLSVLFQEFERYPFSVYEAIGYGDISRIKKRGEIKKAIKKTGMAEYIEGLPQKYRNPLAPEFEKGVKPSVGQWQRLGISRMLFRKNARILIMDEPTSSVDPEAEEKIFRELVRHARDKILIFVTQRFSTVRHADRILVLDKGKIVENGTHKELMKLDGKYAKLFKLQAKGYKS